MQPAISAGKRARACFDSDWAIRTLRDLKGIQSSEEAKKVEIQFKILK